MSGSVFADYDNDGDLDIYVYTENSQWVITCENQPDGPPNLLLHNRLVENGGVIVPGEPLFREAASLAGVDDQASPPFCKLSGHRTNAAAWLDYDRDGCIDLYIGHLVMNAGGTPANRDRLMRNDCAGGFHEVTTAASLYPPAAAEYRGALVVLGAHLDADLWLDLYVVNVTFGTADPASQQADRGRRGRRLSRRSPDVHRRAQRAVGRSSLQMVVLQAAAERIGARKSITGGGLQDRNALRFEPA